MWKVLKASRPLLKAPVGWELQPLVRPVPAMGAVGLLTHRMGAQLQLPRVLQRLRAMVRVYTQCSSSHVVKEKRRLPTPGACSSVLLPPHHQDDY